MDISQELAHIHPMYGAAKNEAHNEEFNSKCEQIAKPMTALWKVLNQKLTGVLPAQVMEDVFA